jgi:DNA-binding transcriptional MerR regulator
MSQPLNQITFEFSGEEEKREFLSGNLIPDEEQKPKSTRGRKKGKDKSLEDDLVEVPEDELLYRKQYYSISEVAAMFKVNASLLRFWEGEFGMELRKNKKGDRFFTPAHIKTLLLIHDLLRRRKFTIEGAKEYIKSNKKADEKYVLIQSLQRIRTFLLEVKAHL